MSKQASVQECEDYIQQHGIQALLKDCIVKICQERPANPYKWLSAHFDKLERVKEGGLDKATALFNPICCILYISVEFTAANF